MSHTDQICQDLLLCWVFSSPCRVWIKGIRVQMTPYYNKLEKLHSLTWERMPTVTAASWVSVIVPSPSNLTAFLDDDKIPTLVPTYHVYGGANA